MMMMMMAARKNPNNNDRTNNTDMYADNTHGTPLAFRDVSK
jgi:hypothetical protein